jgi:hypothetical protein
LHVIQHSGSVIGKRCLFLPGAEGSGEKIEKLLMD